MNIDLLTRFILTAQQSQMGQSALPLSSINPIKSIQDKLLDCAPKNPEVVNFQDPVQKPAIRGKLVPSLHMSAKKLSRDNVFGNIV